MSRPTLKSFKDPRNPSGYSYQRVPRNWRERFLKWRGWEPDGITLLRHPRYHHMSSTTLEEAWEREILYLRKVFHLDKN